MLNHYRQSFEEKPKPMVRRIIFLLFAFLPLLLINCKRQPLNPGPTVTHLSDYESKDGKIELHITGGKQPYRVEWSNGITDTIIKNLNAGIYMVTVSDAKNTIVIDTFNVTQPEWPVCVDLQGNSYKTTVIANKIWMLDNLRVKTNPTGDSIESYVYDNSEENAITYGRLYTWNVAMNNSTTAGSQGICPDGWRIPTDEDWNILIDNISTADKEIPNLKNTLELEYAGFYNNGYQNLDASVSFWTSSDAYDNAWKIYFHKSLSKAFRYHERKTNAISVRCVKDAPEL